MRRILGYTLAMALFLGVHTQKAEAVEFKFAGTFINVFSGYDALNLAKSGEGGIENGNSNSGFDVTQRLQLRMDAIMSEALSATLVIRAPNRSTWGNSPVSSNNANNLVVGSSNDNQIYLVQSYLQWIIPGTDTRVRMGQHREDFPGMMAGSNNSAIMTESPAAGIYTYTPVNDTLGVNLSWRRLGTGKNASNNNDTFTSTGYYADMFSLMLPMNFSDAGMKANLYGAYAIAGENFESTVGRTTIGEIGESSSANGDFTYIVNSKAFNTTNTILRLMGKNTVWVGLNLQYNPLPPMTIYADVLYGNGGGGKWDNGDTSNGGGQLDFDAWVFDGALAYRTDFGTPRLFGWYGTGDSYNDLIEKGRSGIMPSIGSGWGYGDGLDTAFFSKHQHTLAPRSLVLSPAGTWGIGLGMIGIPLAEKLTLSGAVAYVQGTNERSIWTKQYEAAGATDSLDKLHFNPRYMSSSDSMTELSLSTRYEIYRNFTVGTGVNYLIANVDNDLYAYDGENGFRGTVSFQWDF